MTRVPVFITYRDRRTMLDECLDSLFAHGFEARDITIVDNDSEVPLGFSPYDDGPEHYRGCAVVTTRNEARQLAPWLLGLVPEDRPYIVTDCDCAIVPDCPGDLVDVMLDVLDTFPDVAKVGLGINTSNFLDPPPARYRYSYEMERGVQAYPRLTGLRGAPAIAAPVDTTFAMYRPGGHEESGGWPGICGVRLQAPYLIEHLPWLNREYSVEEQLYYSRSDMTTWARTHSAAELVTPKVLVPFTCLRPETVVGLVDSEVQAEITYRPILDDEGYFMALDEFWTPGEGKFPEPFIVVEHDIVVRPETLGELRDCPEDWCAAPYPYLNHERAWGMGCVKFSDRLIARNPWLFQQIGPDGDATHPSRHWCRLDARIFEALTRRGETRHEHEGPALGHVGGRSVAHGCYSPEELEAIGRA